MTTNAMLLDRHIDYLVEKNFRLLISLDGDEYAHSYRVDHSGKNSFHRVFRNIKMVRNKYPEYFDKMVSFISILHNRNSVETSYQFISDNFDKTPMINPLSNLGVRKDKIDEFRAMFQNPLQSLIHSEKCEAIEAGMFGKSPRVLEFARYLHRQSGNVFNNYNDLLVDYSDCDVLPTGTCTPFSKKLFITVNGKILPCERIDHDFSMGHVYDDRVELDCKKVAEKHNDFVFKFVEQCRHCAESRQCSVCVYQKDGIGKENEKCRSFCTQKEFDRKTASILDFLRDHPHYYEKVLNEIVLK